MDVGRLRQVLEADARVAYAILFGSSSRGTPHSHSDVDIAIGLQPGTVLPVAAVGTLIADLEEAAGRRVDLVLLDEAPPALAYRVFRDGTTLLERNHAAMAGRKARAILEYLDFRPLEAIAVRGALAAARRGR